MFVAHGRQFEQRRLIFIDLGPQRRLAICLAPFFGAPERLNFRPHLGLLPPSGLVEPWQGFAYPEGDGRRANPGPKGFCPPRD